MGENRFAPLPVALYGFVFLFAGFAYFLLTRALVAHHGAPSALAAAVGTDLKGKISLVVYLVAVPLAFVSAWVACALYVAVAVVWLVPDPRIERSLTQ
jgi:uncharacterized membrane protein